MWTSLGCEAGPGSCSETTDSLPTTDADSGQLLTLSLKALSNWTLGCISSLICQESHSLYWQDLPNAYWLLPPCSCSSLDVGFFFLPSFTFICLHLLFLHARSGSDVNSCRSVPKDLTCSTFNSSYEYSDLIPSDWCWALLGDSLGILSVVLLEVSIILPHICRPSVHMGSIQLS